MNESLERALQSMDVLNRWVRKTGCSRPRKAVYWLKSKYAIRDAIMAGALTQMRLIQTVVKCNRCKDGIFLDWEGEPRGRCYHCDGKGVAVLKFVETLIVINDRHFTWHSPLSYSSWLGWPMNDLEPVTVTDWQPGKEGIDLDIETAVRHLNVVENHWTQWQKEAPYDYGFDEYDSTRYYNFNYALSLPASGDASSCWRCAGNKIVECVVTFPPGLETRWPTCAACEKDPKIWDEIKAQPLPKLGPELEAWRQRHMLAFADSWNRRWHRDNEEYQFDRKRKNETPTSSLFKIPT